LVLRFPGVQLVLRPYCPLLLVLLCLEGPSIPSSPSILWVQRCLVRPARPGCPADPSLQPPPRDPPLPECLGCPADLSARWVRLFLARPECPADLYPLECPADLRVRPFLARPARPGLLRHLEPPADLWGQLCLESLRCPVDLSTPSTPSSPWVLLHLYSSQFLPDR